MTQNEVAAHYSQDSLIEAIEAALAKLDVTPETATEADLAPVGEFHIGGPPATAHLLDKLNFAADARVLDVGCGTGGAARVLAARVGEVVGIDLTEAYVEAGNAMNRWLGLDGKVELRAGTALDMPFDDGSFDGAVTLHVAMNIEDKWALFSEVGRVLRPGARFGIYDVMRFAYGDFEYPMPWASDSSTSHVATLDDYRRSIEAADLEIVDEENRGAFAEGFFERLRSADAPPSPVGLQLLMGSTAATKLGNLAAAVGSGVLAPMELIVTKP